ncbi:MAG: hypothetical protein IKU03_05610 [Bacteroidales bacterium]|nr:hypothetical protein [Bacteroidales bacterium]
MEENTDIKKEIANTEEEVQITRTANFRRGFFIHLSIFILANIIVWVLWYFLNNIVKEEFSGGLLKICLCFSLIWLVIAIFHYLIAFKWTRTHAEKEVSKLRKKRDKQLEEIRALKNEINENESTLKDKE